LSPDLICSVRAGWTDPLSGLFREIEHRDDI